MLSLNSYIYNNTPLVREEIENATTNIILIFPNITVKHSNRVIIFNGSFNS